ncbi:MAG: hypothetical protein P8Z37_08780 [Acidobacteriota bacterium]
MESKERVLLEKRSFFFPVIIFPYFPHSHTASLIGWKDHKPRILKDIKASFAGKVQLTTEHLQARSFLLGDLLRIRIPIPSIEDLKVSDRDNGLIEIRYNQAETSRLLKFILKGTPENFLMLKSDGMTGDWLQALKERLECSP